MLTRWDADRTVVGRVRFACGAADRFDAPARLGAAISGLSLRLPSLTPSAILCVRQLRQPLPGARRRPAASRHADGSDPDIATSLNRLAQSAARPAHGPVPANAEAVLFADPAELLAALASDWCDGLLHLQWWWRYLVVGAGPQGVVSREWAAQPQYVPAALAQLARERRAAGVVAALTHAEADAITTAVASSIGIASEPLVADLRTIASQPARGEQRARWSGQPAAGDTNAAVTQSERGAARRATTRDAPWQGTVPEADTPGLGTAHQVLLGLALLLQRAPHVVRDQSFDARVIAWRDAVESSAGLIVTAAHERPRPEEHIPPIGEDWQSQTPHDPSGLPSAPTIGARVETSPWLIASGKDDSKDTGAQIGITVRTSSPSAGAAAYSEVVESAGPMPHQSASASTTGRALSRSPIETAYGGVFYLVNVALALELYGDFTMPARPGLRLSIWDFLTIAGRELAGCRFSADPIAPLLAELARRSPDEPPGRTFKPEDAWRIPPAWCAPFPERDGWSWSAARGRLTVLHPCGFFALDAAVGDGVSAEQQLACELTAYALQPSQLRRRSSMRVDRRGLPISRWTRHLMPYLRARLCRAFGADDERCAALICGQRARVHVSASHLDVVFSLAGLPIEVRLAGLDRNPGWVPAAERVIAFHYD